jgi:integrase
MAQTQAKQDTRKPKKGRQRTGVSVTRDSRGYWHFRRELPPDPATGKRRRLDKSDRVKSEARRKFDAALADYERTGRIRTNRSPLLKDWMDRWLDEYKRPTVKPRVYEAYRSDVRNVTRSIGGVRLADLEPRHVRDMEHAITRVRSGKTALNAYIRLRNALTDAVREGLIDSNVCDRVDPPRVSPNPTRILEPGQPGRLIDTQTGEPKGKEWPGGEQERRMWALMWRVAFGTGMRQGERFAITPSELVERDGVHGILVKRELQRYTRDAVIPGWLRAEHIQGTVWSAPPKSRKGVRFIPLDDGLWRDLLAWIEERGIGADELVFTRGGKPLTNPVERRRWTSALAEAGLPYVTIRSARHFFATRLAEAGAPEDARRDIMGHVSIDTTAGYTHWSPQALSALVGKAGKAIDEGVPEIGRGLAA